MKNFGYNTYRFKDKDPVIDMVRTCLQIYASIHNMKLYKAVRDCSHASGVSESCIWNWLSGTTRFPRFCTIAAVVHATGRQVKIGDEGVGSKPRFKVLKGGKAA